MAKETEGERSERRHVVVPRKRHRFSDREVRDMIQALFVLVAHRTREDAPLANHPSLLASALALESAILAEWDALLTRETTPEEDDGIPF